MLHNTFINFVFSGNHLKQEHAVQSWSDHLSKPNMCWRNFDRRVFGWYYHVVLFIIVGTWGCCTGLSHQEIVRVPPITTIAAVHKLFHLTVTLLILWAVALHLTITKPVAVGKGYAWKGLKLIYFICCYVASLRLQSILLHIWAVCSGGSCCCSLFIVSRWDLLFFENTCHLTSVTQYIHQFCFLW